MSANHLQILPAFRATACGAPPIEFCYRKDLDELHTLIETQRLSLERSNARGFLLPRSREDVLAMLGAGPDQPFGRRGLTVCARAPDGRLVGSCFLNEGATGNTARLLARSWFRPGPRAIVTGSTLVVRDDYRGRGLGAKLNEATMRVAHSYERLHLGALDSTNAKALSIYLRQGATLIDAGERALPGSSSVLLAFAKPAALGLCLGQRRASYPLWAPASEWLMQLESGHVGAMRDGELTFFGRRLQ